MAELNFNFSRVTSIFLEYVRESLEAGDVSKNDQSYCARAIRVLFLFFARLKTRQINYPRNIFSQTLPTPRSLILC